MSAIGPGLSTLTVAMPPEALPPSKTAEPEDALQEPTGPESSEAKKRGYGDISWTKVAVAALSIAPVAYAHFETLMSVSNVARDPIFSTVSLVATVNAFRSCMENGFCSLNALMGVACGLSAASGFDRIATAAIGVGVGIGRYGTLTGGFVMLVKFATKVQQGDVPGALLSGARLVAMVALTGHPVALGIIIAADLAYGLHCNLRQPASQAEADDEQKPVAA